MGKQLIEEITINKYQWNLTIKSISKPTRILKANEVTVFDAQVRPLSQKVDNLSTQKLATLISCDTCEGGHASNNCPIIGTAHKSTEQVDFIGSVLR